MICFKCDKEIGDEKKFMIALEVPYINLYVHRVCWHEIKDCLKEYFSNNKQKLLDYIKKQSTIPKKHRNVV